MKYLNINSSSHFDICKAIQENKGGKSGIDKEGNVKFYSGFQIYLHPNQIKRSNDFFNNEGDRAFNVSNNKLSNVSVIKNQSDVKSAQMLEAAKVQYKNLVNNKLKEREDLYHVVTSSIVRVNKITAKHFSLIQRFDINTVKKAEELIKIILNDMMIFPELYTDISDESLKTFFNLLDDTGFRVYFSSSRIASVTDIFIKSHGSLAIANPNLGEGISVSGAGDPAQVKLKLTDPLRDLLINHLSSHDTILPEDIVSKFGNNKNIINILSEKNANGEWAYIHFDSKAIDILITSLPASSHKKELKQLLEKNVFTFKSHKQANAEFQELWPKERL